MKFVFVLAICIVCAAAVTVLKVKNTRQCKAEGGICKQTCSVDEEDTGSCCRNSIHLLTGCEGNSKFVVPEVPTIARGKAESNSWYAKGQQTCYYPHNQSLGKRLLKYNNNRCCQPPTCIGTYKCYTGSCCNSDIRCLPPTCYETLQYAQCKAKNGDIKPVCDVNEQDTGIGPFCNTNRCCEPPTCIAKDCNCKKLDFYCPAFNEYEDSTGNCSGSDICCKPCCLTCGGIFNGPVGSFTSPNYPSKFCNNLNCYYNITVKAGSKVMLTFTYFHLEGGFKTNGLPFDFVQIYDSEVKAEALIDTLSDGPTEGKEFNSTSNKMIIHFVTDDSTYKPGFSVGYKSLQ